jgi:transcriptional regulator with XRE-family HTH domain
MNATKTKSTTKTKKTKAPDSKGNLAGEKLGESLKIYRLAKGTSQEHLGLEAGVDRTYVSQIERGIGNPSLLTLANLCYALDITLAELFATVTISVRPDEKARRANQAELNPAAPKKTRLR